MSNTIEVAMKDMFDLCEQMKLGLNFLNNNVDHNRGCLPYFVTIFKNDPTEARHDWPDFGDLTSRYVESFILARKMLGINTPGSVEMALRKLLLSYFNEGDGLSYRPKPDKPYYSSILNRDYDDHVAEGFDQSRVLWAMLAWYEDGYETSIIKRINELLAGLYNVMIKRDNYGYYDRFTWPPGTSVSQNAEPAPHQFYFAGAQNIPACDGANIAGNGGLVSDVTGQKNI
jgi:hypothetical protein